MLTAIIVGAIVLAACIATLITWGWFSSSGDDLPAQDRLGITDAIPDEDTAELARRYERVMGAES